MSLRAFRRRPKYAAKRTNGFASKKEAGRYQELLLLKKAGAICELKTQVAYTLSVNDQLICLYVADFVYLEETGDKSDPLRVIVEDVKGYRTPEYKIKAKLMKACHGITIRET